MHLTVLRPFRIRRDAVERRPLTVYGVSGLVEGSDGFPFAFRIGARLFLKGVVLGTKQLVDVSERVECRYLLDVFTTPKECYGSLDRKPCVSF